MLHFRFGRWQLFLLIALFVVVAVMTFATGLLYGNRAAEREASSRPVEAPSGSSGSESGAPGTESDDGDGRPQVVYEIQLSSHLRQQDTTPVVDKLLAAGYQAFVVETRDSSNRSLYTVRIGPWSDFAEAAEAAEAFRDHSGLEGLDPKIRHRPRPAMPGDAVKPNDPDAS